MKPGLFLIPHHTLTLIGALLFQIHGNINDCSANLQTKKYVEAAKCIQIVMKELTDIPKELVEKSVFKALEAKYIRLKGELTKAVEKDWHNHFVWQHQNPPSWDSPNGHLHSRFSIQLPLKGGFEETVAALEILGMRDGLLKLLGKKIFTFFMKPMVIFPSLTVTKDAMPTMSSSKESMSKESSSDIRCLKVVKDVNRSKNAKLSAENLYEKLMTIISFLTSHLNSISKSDERAQSFTLVQKLGYFYIWNDLSKLLVKDFLAPSVPTTSSELEGYGRVVQLTECFEECLIESGFIPSGARDLTTYVKNVNVHFSNKKCQEVLLLARDYMKSEIHNMVLVQKQNERAAAMLDLVGEKKLTTKEKVLLSGKMDIEDDMLGAKTFHFPECRISQSAKDVMDLVYKTMIDATSATPPVAIQLFYSAKSTLELFTEVVPIYHRENLKLPQMAALYYNSCMYLAHHCVTLGHQFKQSLPGPLNEGTVTAVDLVSVLQKSGVKCFMDLLVSEKEALFEILKQCGSFTDEDPKVLDQTFNQISYQLIRLSKVWKDVLPSSVYEKSLGRLFDCVLERIITKILRLEDISADEATHFHLLFDSLVKKAPEILAPSSFAGELPILDFSSLMPSWNRFCELAKIMEASLQEIFDRWSEKKSPLSRAFEASELRILIKALFQNTDRRASVLSSIRK